MIFADPGFWVSVGFVIFVGVLLYLKVPAMLAEKLDERAQKIQKQIEEVRQVRTQARDLLVKYQKKQRAAQGEINNITKKASELAEQQTVEVQQYTKKILEQIKKNAQKRIEQIHQDTFIEQRQKTALIAINAAAMILKKKHHSIDHKAMIEGNIEELKKSI